MKICFIGGGNMAEAMVAGMTSHGYEPKDILVFDRNEGKCNNLVKKYNIEISNNLDEMVKQANILILAIKPQGMVDLIKNIRGVVSSNQIIITVAAGIETQAYEELFNKRISFVRAIPNTPSSLGFGATGIFFNKNVTEAKKKLIIDIMETMGEVAIVTNEKEIDVIAAIASSGPAYYFQFMEHMIDAAVENGLDRSQAEKMVVQTCLGAAQMALHSDNISFLRKNITSKNGITHEALRSFQKSDLKNVVSKAIKANICRAKELAQEFTDAI